MPFHNQYFPAFKDPSLEVTPGNKDTPPEGFYEKPFSSPPEAWRCPKGVMQHAHYCHYCKGWIPGMPSAYQENTLGPLCGRRGTAYHCRRCGKEIAFSGCVS